jgi:AcrR family transcriptional regulator
MDTIAGAVSLPRQPQQARSRASYERMLKSARDLLALRGYEGFTLMEVSKLGGVSIGSIYNRVAGKEELMQVIHASVLADLEVAQNDLLASNQYRSSLSALFEGLIIGFGDILREYAPLLRPLMLRANTDTNIGAAGTEAYHSFFERAVALVMTHASEVRQTDPEKAIRFTLFIAYSAYRNHLGLGSTHGESNEQDWREMQNSLVALCVGHLLAR